MPSQRKPPSKASKTAPTQAKAKRQQQPEKTHRERFDQLLDDVVFGKPPKR